MQGPLSWVGPEILKSNRSAINSITLWGSRDELVFQRDEASIILLEGYPQDASVIEAITQLFQKEQYPNRFLGHRPDWTPFVNTYAGHQVLGPIIDDWLEKRIVQQKENSHSIFWNYELCLISRSERAKGFLLKAVEENDSFLQVRIAEWLLKGWGIQDEQVATVLTRLANSEAAKTIAGLLPDIILDKEECYQRLLNILYNTETARL